MVKTWISSFRRVIYDSYREHQSHIVISQLRHNVGLFYVCVVLHIFNILFACSREVGQSLFVAGIHKLWKVVEAIVCSQYFFTNFAFVCSEERCPAQLIALFMANAMVHCIYATFK